MACQLVVKPRITEHTLSQEVIIDKKCWEVNYKDNLGCYGGTRLRSNFDLMLECGYVSKLFRADDDGDIFWCIQMSQESTNSKKEYQVQLYMKPVRDDVNVLVWGKLQTNLSLPFSKKNPDEPYTKKLTRSGSYIVFSETKLEENFEKFRIDLTYAKWSRSKQDSLTAVQLYVTPTTDQKESLTSGVAALFENPVASDVTLRCDDREWKLHKNILAAQSKMFAAMFSIDMKENSEGVVEIKNVESKTLDLMFKFLYNVEIRDIEMENAAEDLLILADRYDVQALKKRSEKILISQLHLENCLHLFILGHQYNSELLFASAKGVLIRHLPTICKTNQYKVFVKENVDLSIEVLSAQLSGNW